MRRASAFLASPLVLLLTSCGTHVDLVSLPTRPFTDKVQRVFLVYTPPPGGSGHLQTELDRALVTRLQGRGVVCQGWVRNPLDLHEEEKLAAAMAQFKPRHRLALGQGALQDSRSWSPGGPFNTGGTATETHATTMELELRDLATQEVVWKGRLACTSSASELNAATVADRIMDALGQDGVIPAAVK
ncbi:MAG TPA: hypothetical protein VJ623_09015 [Holophagaceae bacterium]|nr:hypothetical protein [Holophagaceae bacterium]